MQTTIIKNHQLAASTMMRIASRPASAPEKIDDIDDMCDVGLVASTAFCGGDFTTATKSYQTASTTQKRGTSIKNKLTAIIPAKSNQSKPKGESDIRAVTASTSPSPSSYSNGSSLHQHSSLASEVGKSAHEYLEECLVTEVSVLDRDKFDAVPEYQKDQLNIGEHLGKGSYSDVFEVVVNISIFDEKNETIDDIINERLKDLSLSSTTGPSPPIAAIHQKNQEVNSRDDSTVTGRRPPRARRVTFSNSVREPVKNLHRCDERSEVYAMKCLRPQIRSDAEQFIIGAEDLVHETALLATLDHPNIIRLHGRAAGQLKNAFTLNDGYFILIDRLKKETLKDCIGEWWRYPEFYLQGPTERQMDIALSIADAISYLHSKNIVYRDLKPANVGFDNQGAVKLFDFGFAMGLPEENSVDESNPGGLLFDKCGTPRYMAPECGLELGYRTEADVYSFGILLWEMCSLDKPFAEFKNADDFERAVFIQGVRPSVKKHWPSSLSNTIKNCWSNRPGKRPSLEDVKNILREVKTSLSGDESGKQRRPRYSRATRRLSINMGHGYILG